MGQTPKGLTKDNTLASPAKPQPPEIPISPPRSQYWSLCGACVSVGERDATTHVRERGSFAHKQSQWPEGRSWLAGGNRINTPTAVTRRGVLSCWFLGRPSCRDVAELWGGARMARLTAPHTHSPQPRVPGCLPLNHTAWKVSSPTTAMTNTLRSRPPALSPPTAPLWSWFIPDLRS